MVIYKTPDANIAGFGLSGTADLRTVRPLDFKDRTIAVNVRGEVNTGKQLNADVGNWGGRASFSYIDKITPELGVAFGVAYLDSPSQTKHTSVYNYEQFCPGGEDWCTYLRDQISPDSADLAFFPTGQEVFARSKTNKRLASIGIIEWEPSDRVHTIVDLYYSRFKQRETMRGAQWFDNLWVDNTNYTNVETEDFDGNLIGVRGTATNISPQLRNDYNKRDDRLFSAGLNNEFKINDELKFIDGPQLFAQQAGRERDRDLCRLRLRSEQHYAWSRVRYRGRAERQSRIRHDQLGRQRQHRRRRLPAVFGRPRLRRRHPGIAWRSRPVGRLGT